MFLKYEQLQTKKGLDITWKVFDEQIASISTSNLEILPVEIEQWIFLYVIGLQAKKVELDWIQLEKPKNNFNSYLDECSKLRWSVISSRFSTPRRL